MLSREITGGVPQALISQPSLHRCMDDWVRRNPAPTPKVHPKVFLPDVWLCLHVYNLGPQFGDPPDAPEGLVLIVRKSVRCDVRWFPSKNVSFSVRVNSKTRNFSLGDHSQQSNLRELALCLGITAANV